ncbi:DUF6527 family protein [Rhizobium leguminosarum]|uniref:DUF6527 family protein n=1 Tax=Rhizobium leguminosarum TaxID=384 RepID=UPI0014426146|nr:DUF6527 family protein [Rhizobium leguminosarum]NKN03071.1 hypothetical protein [Rhizobium leguminosarum bv. viciae]
MLRSSIVKVLAWFGIIEKPQFLAKAALDMPAPDELGPGQAIVVGSAERPKWITFPCPSGCGVALLLSLNPDRRPRWNVTQDWLGRPSITPSIHRTDGCRCHFWMKKGKVEWCKDSGGILPEN